MMLQGTPHRLHEIDGIRGWAAFIVLIYHFAFFPFIKLFPEFFAPHFLLVDGVLAVQIFFILSGDALSAGYFSSKDKNVVARLLLKRYPRLTMPIFCSCLCVFALMVTGNDHHAQASGLIRREEWLGAVLPFSPDFWAMLHYSFVQVYIADAVAVSYNPFLWTMSIELAGSALIFLFLFLSRSLVSIPWVLGFLILALMIFVPNSAGFFVGALYGYARHTGWFGKWHHSEIWRCCAWPVSFCLLLAGLLLPPTRLPAQGDLLHASAWVFVFYATPAYLAFFRSRLSRWLGDLSFPIYVMHFAVLISLTSGLIVWFAGHGGLNGGNVSLIILTSFIATFAVAWLLRRLEIPYLRALGHLVDYVLKEKADTRPS